MDFKQCVSKAVDEVLCRYMKTVSKKYSIEYKDLEDIWQHNTIDTSQIGTTSQSIPSPSPSPSSNANINSDINPKIIDCVELRKSTVMELKGMCKQRGLKCSGKKDDILRRLLDVEKSTPKTNTSVFVSKNVYKHDVIKQLKSNVSSSIQLRRNAYGNYQHPHSDLIFNDQKKVYGTQKDDGTLEDLNAESINICKKYNFDYVIPDNLNTNDADIDIEEFDSDEEVEDEVEDKVEDEVEDEVEDTEPASNQVLSTEYVEADNDDISEEELLEDEDEDIPLDDEYY